MNPIFITKYYTLFQEDGWDDADTASLISEADLVGMGIVAKGHIKRIMTAVAELSKPTAQVHDTPPRATELRGGIAGRAGH